jgi:hypothetical protein
MPFEYFVRPFQSPDSHGRIIIPSVPGGTQRATLTWGAKTSIVPTSLQHQVRFQYVHDPNDPVTCCTEQLDEQDRDTDTIKITSTSDPDAWITVKRATQLRVDKKAANTCNGQPPWEPQIDQSAQSVLDNMATEAAFMGVREPTVEKCRTVLNLKANTTGA